MFVNQFIDTLELLRNGSGRTGGCSIGYRFFNQRRQGTRDWAVRKIEPKRFHGM